METVGTILKLQPNALMTWTKNGTTGYLQNTKRNQAFLTRFSPQRKITYHSNPESAVAVIKTNPTLAEVDSIYGTSLTNEWLNVNLFHTFTACGFSFVGNNLTIDYVVEKLHNRFDYLRLGEIQLFLSLFENGEYGDFCRVFNMQKFFLSISLFLKKRQELKDNYDKKLIQEQEKNKHYVPCPENLEIAKRIQQQFKK